MKYLRWGVMNVWMAWLAMQAPTYASTPLIWEQSSADHFQHGKLKSISIASQGRLTLAPSLESIFETEEPLLWCIIIDSHGNTYAGSGNDGKLFKIDPSGHGSTFFDADELEIHSLAIDESDHLFAATFPDGKIYKLTPEGVSSVLFDPNEGGTESVDRYIWSLAVDREGNVYAGTGEHGRVYKIDRNGRASVLAKTGETHVVSLVLDRDGSLLAGTAPNGRLYRISPSGAMSVLYDSPFQEIHAIVVDRSGIIYAGAVNEPRRRRGGGVVRQPAAVSTPSGDRRNNSNIGVLEVTATADGNPGNTTFRPSRSGGGVVYRIRPDGVVQEWWRSRDDACFALGFRADGALLVGTGPRGFLYAVSTRGRNTTLARIGESQITSLARTASNQIMIASSNLGNIYRMGVRPVEEGTFESKTKDTGGISVWGRIRWEGERPSGTTVRLYTRTGNTDAPDDTWSTWSKPYSDMGGDGTAITSPPARYIQWKAELRTKNAATPVVSTVAVAYLTRNIAPVIEKVTVYAPGVYLRDSSGGGDSRVEDLPPKVSDQVGNRPSGGRKRQPNAGIPAYRKGMRAVSVDADDANDDDLTYAVYFRGEHETEWKLLKDHLSNPSYSWDSETLPDGMYTVKVVVSDAPSNPPALALRTEMESSPFLVDNTSPRVENLTRGRAAQQTALTFTVRDAASPIYKVEYATDGGDWRVIYPTDGVADSRSETFELGLNDLKTGEHTVAIRAKDISNNVGAGKLVISTP